MVTKTLSKEISDAEAEKARGLDGALPLDKWLRCRIRYFTDGAVVGSRSLVDEAFAKSRSRCGPKRAAGARRLMGEAAPASPTLWGLRDLRKGVV